MTKHNQIHTLGASQYKVHFQFSRKLKEFKCALWSEKYGNLHYRFLIHTKSFIFWLNFI